MPSAELTDRLSQTVIGLERRYDEEVQAREAAERAREAEARARELAERDREAAQARTAELEAELRRLRGDG